MNRHRLDHVALLLAAQGSRRQAIRVITAGLVSTLALGRAAQPASAAICPERVPRPGYRPTVNGCGPSGYGWAIPDSWNRANFTPACNAHDRCYGTCNKSRQQCDIQMRNRMWAACDRAYGRRGQENLWRLRCRDRANTYFKAVRRGGQAAYEDAQEEACICCNQGDRGQKCGKNCCAAGAVCASPTTGVCCQPGQTCGGGCCPVDWCYDCIQGSCQPRCSPNQWCNRNVCEDCGAWGCGG